MRQAIQRKLARTIKDLVSALGQSRVAHGIQDILNPGEGVAGGNCGDA
ncbi:MAG: hypothetical protein PHQ04_08315 [Opitutaceae bacterium]|nr:hypothetical protein [Opitutaceae bacterium]